MPALILFGLTNINSVAQERQESSWQSYSIKIDSVTTLPKGNKFILQIFTRILNNTDNALKYWELECGTKEFLYYVDPRDMALTDSVRCLANFVSPYILAPHAVRHDTLQIKRTSFNKRAIKFKLGCYIFKDPKDFDHYTSTGTPKNAIKLWSKQIIWDNKLVHLEK